MYLIQFEDGTTERQSLEELETHKNQNVVNIGDISFKVAKHFSRSEYFSGVVTKKCVNGKYECKFNDDEIKKYTIEQIEKFASLQR